MVYPTKIKVVFSERTCDVDSLPGELLCESLRRHRIPLGAVHIELHNPQGVQPLMGHERLENLDGRVVATVNRNIRLFDVISATTSIAHTEDAVTSYLTLNGHTDNPFDGTLIELSEPDIQRIAIQAVKSTVAESFQQIQERNVLVGFSGGGDSNLLLTAISQSGLFSPDYIVPAMILGIPDWDQQLKQAQDLSTQLGFSLHVIDERQSALIAGIYAIPNALSRFEKEFPSTSIEFFGTWLLRRVLARLSDNYKAYCVFLGGNREDTLAEALYCLTNGLQPLPFPVRTIGDTIFINPLYMLPKRVVDAAYPDYSGANYRSRSQSADIGRTSYYYIAHILQEYLPGFDISLMNGMQRLTKNDQFVWDEQLKDFIHKDASKPLRNKWLNVIKGYKT